MHAVTFETKDAGGIMLSRVVELVIENGKVISSTPVTAFDIPAITISQAEHISTAHLLAALGVKNEVTANLESARREQAVEPDQSSSDGHAGKVSPSAKRKP